MENIGFVEDGPARTGKLARALLRSSKENWSVSIRHTISGWSVFVVCVRGRATSAK